MPEDREPTEIRVTGRLNLPGDEAVFVVTDVVYDPADCLAVGMVLRVPEGPDVRWTFSWELLGRGLLAPAGVGDVRVRPVPGHFPLVEVTLTRSCSARLLLPAGQISHFLTRVREFARRDADRVARDLDAELAAIMAEH